MSPHENHFNFDGEEAREADMEFIRHQLATGEVPRVRGILVNHDLAQIARVDESCFPLDRQWPENDYREFWKQQRQKEAK